MWCQRSDGARVDGSLCGGGQPSGSEGYSNTGACSYSASYGGWGACSGGTQTRSVTCTRSDGARVDASLCGLPNTQSQGCSSGQPNGYCLFVTNEYSDNENASYAGDRMNQDWSNYRVLGIDNYPIGANSKCASGYSGWRADVSTGIPYGAACSPVVQMCIERNPNQSAKYPR